MGHAVFWFVNGSLGLLFRFRPDCHLRYAKGNLIEDLKHQTISGLVDGAGRFPAPCQSSQVHGDGLVRPDGSSAASFPHAISTCFWARFLTSDRFVSLKFVLKVKAS